MTMLDPKALNAAKQTFGDALSWGADPQDALSSALSAFADALSSLPAQAVGVTDVMIDAAGRFRWGPDWSGKLDKEDWEDTRSLLLAALSASPPSQPAAVGVSDEMVGRFMDDMFGEYTTPSNDQTWVSPNWMETKAKVRAALEAALRSTP